VPHFPSAFVHVTDGAPLHRLVDRAITALKRAGASPKRVREFIDCMPNSYALAIDFIREWCETD
jgi:hypothetical protein